MSFPAEPQTVPSWPAPRVTAPLDANVRIPGSKSLTNRYLVLAALADGPSRLRAPLHSRDTALMVASLRALGAEVREVDGDGAFGPDLEVHPLETGSASGARIDCGLAGTVMRFVPPLAALKNGTTAFDGDPHARLRPMSATISALRGLGVAVHDDGAGALPFSVSGTGDVAGGRLEIDAGASSQFVSALLLAGARFRNGLHLVHVGSTVPSREHIAMTVGVLRGAGVSVDDGRVGEQFGELPAPVIVLFHDGDGNTALLQCCGQIDAHAATAAEQAVSHAAGDDTQIFQQCGQILGGSRNEYAVTLLEGKGTTVRNQCMAAPQDSADQNAAFDNAGQIHQLCAQKLAFGINTQLHNLGTALGEDITAQEAGEFQKPLDFVGSLTLRIDGHGQTENITQLIDLVVVFRITDTCDGMQFGVNAMGSGAAQQIDFIRIGSGDQQIRILDTGLL